MAYKIGGWIGSIQQAVPEKPTAQPPNFFGKVGFLREKKTSFILYLLFLWAVVPPNCEVIITTTVHTLFYFGGNGK